MRSAQSQSHATATEPKIIVIPKDRLHPPTPARLSASTIPPDLPPLVRPASHTMPNRTLQLEHTHFYHYGTFTRRIYSQYGQSRTQRHLYDTLAISVMYSLRFPPALDIIPTLNVIVFETHVIGCVKQEPETPSRDSFGEAQTYNKQPPNSLGKQGFCRR